MKFIKSFFALGIIFAIPAFAGFLLFVPFIMPMKQDCIVVADGKEYRCAMYMPVDGGAMCKVRLYKTMESCPEFLIGEISCTNYFIKHE